MVASGSSLYVLLPLLCVVSRAPVINALTRPTQAAAADTSSITVGHRDCGVRRPMLGLNLELIHSEAQEREHVPRVLLIPGKNVLLPTRAG